MSGKSTIVIRLQIDGENIDSNNNSVTVIEKMSYHKMGEDERYYEKHDLSIHVICYHCIYKKAIVWKR